MVSSKILLALGLFSSTLAQLSPRACTTTIKAKTGDTCASVSSAQGISVSQFLLNNPTIASCDLVAGTDYCITDDGATTTPDTPSLTISTDGTCGSGVTCLGSKFGSCCSEHGYCGDSDVYCTAGCQVAFGSCNGTGIVPTTTVPPAGTSTVLVTVTTTRVVSSTATTVATRTTTFTVGATATTTITSVALTTSMVSRTVTVPATATSTAVVTLTSLVLTTSTAIRSLTVTVPATATTVVTTTSLVFATATSTQVVTVTSLVLATSTSLVLSTSVRTSIVLSTSLVTRTVTSVVVVDSETATVTVTSARATVTQTSVISGACSPTRPDTPITTTRSSTIPTATPSPVFPGTVSNCKSYDKIRNGDTCQTVVSRNGMTFAQLYSWNPSVGGNLLNQILCTPGLIQLLIDGVCQVSCDSLWEGYYLCVSA